MNKSQSPFRFDHRELTVIFSLFIFTSLLMFTIGVVVGKSLGPNKLTTVAAQSEESAHNNPTKEGETHQVATHDTGTSVSTDHAPTSNKNEHGPTTHLDNLTAEVSEPVKEHKNQETTPKAHSTPPTAELELIPEKPRTGDVRATLADLTDQEEVGKVLSNPKVQELLETSSAPKPKPKKRAIASTSPQSFPEGTYTVQVGSYPSQADATMRVDQLRKLGYPFAYLSTKELGDKKEPWYRVWLGYFPDSESAKANGELLQQRGEVKSYLVRRSETKED